MHGDRLPREFLSMKEKAAKEKKVFTSSCAMLCCACCGSTCGLEALCCTDSSLYFLPGPIWDKVWAARDLERLS